jgi:hypothetical protein
VKIPQNLNLDFDIKLSYHPYLTSPVKGEERKECGMNLKLMRMETLYTTPCVSTSYLPHPHEWNLKNVQYSCGF